MRTRGIVVVGIVGLMVFSGSTAEGQDPKLLQLLNGPFAFTGETTCLISVGGFNTNLTPVGPPAPFPFVLSLSTQGVRTFNGDGTGSFVARNVTTSHPFALPTDPPIFNRGGAGSTDVEADFTYEVTADGLFTIEQPVATGTILTGSRAGQTFTLGPIPVSGFISSDRRTLTTAPDEPTIETITYSNGDVHHRICHRSRVLLFIGKGLVKPK